MVGGDGSVRREMRFRTPTTEDHATAASNGGTFTASGKEPSGPTQNTSSASSSNSHEPTSSRNNEARNRNHQARPTARVVPSSNHSKADTSSSTNPIPSSTRSKSARTRREDPQQRVNPSTTSAKEAEAATSHRRGQPDGAIDPNSSTAPFSVPPTSTFRDTRYLE